LIFLALLLLDYLCPFPFSWLALLVGAVLDWRRNRNRKWRLFYLFVYLYLLLGLLPLPRQISEPEVIVYKSSRELRHGEKKMRIGLGNHPGGHKQQEGDGRTPEGFYQVCSKESATQLGPWIGLDYPNRQDAWAGRLQNQVSWLELTRWNWFWRKEPPQTTRLGGQVGIHGGGSRRNWTLGCIALDEPDIQELFQRLPIGAWVEIRP
jgi:hypothetical protein